jgi:hypothetical protein
VVLMTDPIGSGSTFKIPGIGPVKKNTAYMVGAVVVIGGILYYRSRQAANAATIAASGESVGINPATGYVYGSAEDAAALANQAAYQTPGIGSGGGGGGGTSATTGFVSNAQWTQSAVNSLVDAGAVDSTALLTAALGKYLSGRALTVDEQSLVQQAIAIAGLPPVSGPNGFPPSMNTQPAPSPFDNLPVDDPNVPHTTGVITNPNETVASLSFLYWNTTAYGPNIYYANKGKIDANKGKLLGLDLYIPPDPRKASVA